MTKVVKFVGVVDLLKKLNKRMTCTAVPARTMRNIETNDSPQKEKKRNIRTIGNLELGVIAANPPGVWPVFTLPTRGLKLYTLPT